MAKEEHEAKVTAGAAGDEAAIREAGAGAPGDEGVVRGAGAGTSDDGSAARETVAGAADGEAVTRGSGAGAPEGRSAGRETGGPDGEEAVGEAGGDDAHVRTEEPEAPDGSPEDALAEARRAAQENLDRALRAQAEIENVRRRAERDLAHAHKFALERFVSELLPVKDSLELGLAASAEKGATAASIAEGVELTLRMFEQAMEKFGVETVDPAGDPFNPEFHQAMTMQESDTAASGTVLTVVQKGCLLNERLVRPAMVIVAK